MPEYTITNHSSSESDDLPEYRVVKYTIQLTRSEIG